MCSDSAASDATIIIPQHGQAELTIAVVRGLRRFERVRFPIVVVDDGSRPEAVALIEQSCGDVRLVRQPHLGVTAAWNRGLEQVATTFAVLLNNDVIVHGAWVDALVQPLREGSAALSGVELRRERAVSSTVLELLGRSEFLAGWCWAFRAADARGLGGFDESLRLYFSDTDLQARLLARTGRRSPPTVVRGLPLRHAGHATTRLLPDRVAMWQGDRARFIEKWTEIGA